MRLLLLLWGGSCSEVVAAMLCGAAMGMVVVTTVATVWGLGSCSMWHVGVPCSVVLRRLLARHVESWVFLTFCLFLLGRIPSGTSCCFAFLASHAVSSIEPTTHFCNNFLPVSRRMQHRHGGQDSAILTTQDGQ